MTLPELRDQVCRANKRLEATGLVHGTFGNVSGVDFGSGVFVIKPSGVDYSDLTPELMVAVSIETGDAIESTLRPSSDTATHLELYRSFRCGGIVHTHSEAATTLAQARLPLRCMGTTHADHFRGDIPVTRPLRNDEIATDYERHTGVVIVETFRAAGVSPDEVPAVLVANHAPFVWGKDPFAAIELAQVLEVLARMDLTQRAIAPAAPKPAECLVDKHYFRKHGASAYYGQER
jgi:L-ribulose-5-phosphate 4-epimerase